MATPTLAILDKAEALQKLEMILAPEQRPTTDAIRATMRLDGDATAVGMAISERLGEVFKDGIITLSEHPLGGQVLPAYAEALCVAGQQLAEGTPANPECVKEYLMNHLLTLHKDFMVVFNKTHSNSINTMAEMQANALQSQGQQGTHALSAVTSLAAGGAKLAMDQARH